MYTSVDIQNEMLKTMALYVLRQIIKSLEQTPFITLMVDKTIDISNKERALFCLRLVNCEFEVHEEFIGLHVIDSTDASHIFAMTKAVLTQLHIPMNKIGGQCYDRAAAMTGTRSGVAKLAIVLYLFNLYFCPFLSVSFVGRNCNTCSCAIKSHNQKYKITLCILINVIETLELKTHNH